VELTRAALDRACRPSWTTTERGGLDGAAACTVDASTRTNAATSSSERQPQPRGQRRVSRIGGSTSGRVGRRNGRHDPTLNRGHRAGIAGVMDQDMGGELMPSGDRRTARIAGRHRGRRHSDRMPHGDSGGARRDATAPLSRLATTAFGQTAGPAAATGVVSQGKSLSGTVRRWRSDRRVAPGRWDHTARIGHRRGVPSFPWLQPKSQLWAAAPSVGRSIRSPSRSEPGVRANLRTKVTKGSRQFQRHDEINSSMR